MKNYNLLNRTAREVITQKFKSLDQVEDFLQTNIQFDIIEEHFKVLLSEEQDS